MYSATVKRGGDGESVDNEAALSIFGVVLGVIGSGAVLLFWSMARIQLHTRNGGFINDLGLGGAWLWLFNSYVFVMVACTLLAGLLYFVLKRYKEAAGVAALPVAGAIVYYLALVALR